MSVNSTTEGGETRPQFTPKWYLNGFPKSGLHLCEEMLGPIARPMPDGQVRGTPWVGTFSSHSWVNDWVSEKQTLYWLGELRQGFYHKGHCGWTQNIEALTWCLGISHVFIYRDPRDVAVSQMYHILSDNPRLLHPAKEKYKALGSKVKILKAVIVGLDEYAGVMDRWADYAPWLDVPWIFKFKYEDAITDPLKTAHDLATYGVKRLAEVFDLDFTTGIDVDKVAETMAEAAGKKQAFNFRAGRVGDWRQEFNEEHKKLFKQTDCNNWLIRLGYEQDRDW